MKRLRWVVQDRLNPLVPRRLLSPDALLLVLVPVLKSGRVRVKMVGPRLRRLVKSRGHPFTKRPLLVPLELPIRLLMESKVVVGPKVPFALVLPLLVLLVVLLVVVITDLHTLPKVLPLLTVSRLQDRRTLDRPRLTLVAIRLPVVLKLREQLILIGQVARN